MSAPAEEKIPFERLPDVTGGVVFIVGEGVLFEQVVAALSDFLDAEIQLLSTDGLVVAAMRVGTWDALARPLDQVRTAIGGALREISASPTSATRFSGKPSPSEASVAVNSLTRRQKAVLERIIEGRPNKIIAAELGICLRTAENHRAAIMRKLHVKSVARLVQVALAALEG